jgi:hypothetical protein
MSRKTERRPFIIRRLRFRNQYAADTQGRAACNRKSGQQQRRCDVGSKAA